MNSPTTAEMNGAMKTLIAFCASRNAPLTTAKINAKGVPICIVVAIGEPMTEALSGVVEIIKEETGGIAVKLTPETNN